MSWKRFCQSVGGELEAKCGQFRALVSPVVGSEESSDLLDEACLDLMKTFSQPARLTLEIFKTTKLLRIIFDPILVIYKKFPENSTNSSILGKFRSRKLTKLCYRPVDI